MDERDQDKKVRLFTALRVPAEFTAAVKKLSRKGLEAHWLPPDDLHITLRFLGDLPLERVPEIRQVLDRVRRPRFSVDTGGLGRFDLKKQSVLWAAVQSTRKLTALAGDINEVLAPLGFEMPVKPYVPHVTLARLKSSKGLDSYIKQHEKALSFHWQACSFGLYYSAPPDEKGNRYRSLSEFPLQP